MRAIRLLMLLLLLPLLGSSVAAQTFNPSDPPEPNVNYVPKHNVVVKSTPEGVAYTSGTGRYAEGTSIRIATSSAVAGWVFQRWLINGEIDTQHTSTSFNITLGDSDVTYIAEYQYDESQIPTLPEFNPADPAEPTYRDPAPTDPSVQPDPTYRLNIVSIPAEACSFNINSGARYKQGTNVAIRAYGNQNFRFVGWYTSEGTLIASAQNFTFTTLDNDTTLEARWEFDPGMPADPAGGSQDNVDQTQGLSCDINHDGEVDVSDLAALINIITGVSNPIRTADLNNDNEIDVSDLASLINIITGLSH